MILGVKLLKHILSFGKYSGQYLSVHVDEVVGGKLNVHVCPLGAGR